MTELAVGLGVILSLVISELTGVASGGIVVPGYLALQVHQPEHLINTFVVALATYGLIRLVSRYTFMFGKRRLVLTLLVGFILGAVSRQDDLIFNTRLLTGDAIGFIVPGLLANWMDKQGISKTVTMSLFTAVVVRLLLILFASEVGF